jgi:hypothetical protein
VADGAVYSVVDQSVSVGTSALAEQYDVIAPWVGKGVARLLEGARNATDHLRLVIEAAIQTCLINCCIHLLAPRMRNKKIEAEYQVLLALLHSTGRYQLSFTMCGI